MPNFPSERKRVLRDLIKNIDDPQLEEDLILSLTTERQLVGEELEEARKRWQEFVKTVLGKG